MTQIQEIKDRISIAQIIGEHVKLTPTGVYQKGLCPFHHEKSPSFFVNDTLGFYKCFGCGESGDAFTFLQKYDGLTFREALEALAERAGVKLTTSQPSPEDKLRERVLEILRLSADFYQQKYQSAAGKPARDYLESRGTSASLIKLFGIGASGDEWQELTDFLRQQKFKDKEIVASGMARTNKTGRLYDTFRGRVMFPLRNHRGQIVGFSGRQLVAHPNEGKYINTPETIVYHKGKMLLGLHEFSHSIRKAGQMLIVEGEFDMLSSAQANVDWVCAIKGSALTSDHANLIARYTRKVLLSLDGDAAGIKATKKAIQVLRPVGVELRVVMLDPGRDPDEMARANPSQWRERVKASVSVYDFFLQVITRSHNCKSIDGQKAILQEMATVFALIDNRLEYEFYLKKLAAILGQDLDVVRADIAHWGQNTPTTNKSANGQSSVDQRKTKPRRTLTKLQKLEAYVWFLFLQSLTDNQLTAQTGAYIVTTQWSNSFLQKLAALYQTYLSTHPTPTLKQWSATLPEDYQSKIAILSLNQQFIKLLAKTDLASEWERVRSAHAREVGLRTLADVKRQLAALDEIADPTIEQEQRKDELLQQIINLQKTWTTSN